jgi:single-stranded-DNA-specific exonuclease
LLLRERENKMNWIIEKNENLEIVNQLSKELNIDTILSLMLVKRGIKSFNQAKDFFRPNIDKLHDPFLMKDMGLAVDRILSAIEDKESIMVFGDYDVDGTSSVALLSMYLKSQGCKITPYFPDRNLEGYGISIKAIDEAAQNNQNLIIALDCGIKAHEQVNYALDKKINFIICDHHNPDESIPNALAVLNPKRKDCIYPFKELCGCGVGFKLIQALELKINKKIDNIINYLDLVAIAIAADIVPLVGENRILAHIGIQIINSNPRTGINSLFKNRVKKEFNIGDLMFHIAPRINAAGRMEHASLALELLIETDTQKADELALKIESLNDLRREVEKETTNQALNYLKEDKKETNSTVVFNKSWNKGVIGIVASRLIEKHYKPTVVFCEVKEGELAASARSVKGIDLYKVLEECKETIVQFGGHKYAAGLTIKKENYLSFKNKFETSVSKIFESKSSEPEIIIESEIDLDVITPKFYRILKQFEPFGPGNRTPMFLTKELKIKNKEFKLGKEKEHIKLNLTQDNIQTYSAIGFWLSDKFTAIKDSSNFSAVYSLDENTWNGSTTMQLNIKDLK